jgi:hypothetical protein
MSKPKYQKEFEDSVGKLTPQAKAMTLVTEIAYEENLVTRLQLALDTIELLKTIK